MQARPVIGITGNIACGKSAVLEILGELGALTVDADVLAHEVMAPEGPAYAPVVERFGPGILAPSGEIDRRRLGQIVFSDPSSLEALERIVHPFVFERALGIIERSTRPVAIDAIKLIESGMGRLCDQVWVVTCPRDQQVRRLRERNGFTEVEALLRIEAQPPQEEKVHSADVVIDNSGSLESTRRQVVEAWERLVGTEPSVPTA